MSDIPAGARWPDVPACYDWLSLDRRGNWRLQGERITHGGLIAFINRQYAVDEGGRWFVQNGPQRVFVTLACTPWIFRRESTGFVSHTGQPAGALHAIYLDEEGSLLLASELGIGLVDDRDLAQCLDECRDARGTPASETAFLALLAGQAADIYWQDLPLRTIAAVDLPKRFKFATHPQP